MGETVSRSAETPLDVVIVDDDTATLLLLERHLQKAGLAFETFSNAEVALDYLHVHRTGVLVLDQRMPIFTGLELLQRLVDSAALDGTRVYLATACTPTSEIRRRGEELGAEVIGKGQLLDRERLPRLLASVSATSSSCVSAS